MSKNKRQDGEEGARLFEVGPDQGGDLRTHRPYFIVPLQGEPDDEDLTGGVLERVANWIELSTREVERGGDGKSDVTDLYVLSHGWHRNLFKAMAAYDRLSCRFAQLLHRGRLTPDPDRSFHPIFLHLHWHSDIGSNGFVDPSGRRLKGDFLSRARHMFEPISQDPHFSAKGESATFSNDFEDLYQFLATVSAPDINAMSSSFETRAETLEGRLNHYTIRDAPAATSYDKATAVWSCYHESEPQRPLVEQSEQPGESVSIKESFSGCSRFLVAVLGLMTVLSFVWGLLKGGGVLQWLGRTAQGIALPELAWWEWTAGVYVGAWILLFIAVGIQHQQQQDQKDLHKKSQSLPFGGVIAWGVLTLFHAVPYLLYCVFTYPFNRIIPGKPFDERFGPRGKAPVPYELWSKRRFELRLALSRFACIPSAAIRNTMRIESAVFTMVDTVESQLRFSDMQIRAVRSSEQAARFLVDLGDRCTAVRNARIHVIGHSFGGLLIANLAKNLAYSKRFRETFTRDKPVTTLCPLQGALASRWFDDEPYVTESVGGCIAAVYSRYDTANGFYYPLACHGRKAMGAVGASLEEESPQMPILKPLPSAALTATPNFARRIAQNGGTPRYPAILNIDASRIIFEGPPASGGGHGDIFKDDVIHLLWAAQNYRVD